MPHQGSSNYSNSSKTFYWPCEPLSSTAAEDLILPADLGAGSVQVRWGAAAASELAVSTRLTLRMLLQS